MIVAGIASVPAREYMLIKTVDSLYDQVDVIYVALNGYRDIPGVLMSRSKVKCDLLNNSLKDSAKFLHLKDCDGYFFGADDDIAYPPNYCQYMISKIKQYNCIVTLHGRRYGNRPIRGFKRGFTLNYHCLHSYSEDENLDLGGTGVMAFDTKRFTFPMSIFEEHGMADVFVAREAYRQGVRIMGVAHKNTFLHYQQPPDQTLWQYWKSDAIQTRILQSFLK